MFLKMSWVVCVALLVGCSSMPGSKPDSGQGSKPDSATAAEPASAATPEEKSRQALSSGINDFANGNYAAATKNIQSALDFGLDNRNQVKAHKYLAFINCVTNKTRACRDEFVKALKIDPAMELEPAEAGHPIWGPVFKNAKAGLKAGAKPKAKKPAPASPQK